jgi:hypothetical protein
MSKLQEFQQQLVDVNRIIEEHEELREDLQIRIDKLQQEKVNGMFLTNDQLHKLLCYMDNTIIDHDAIPNIEDRNNLYEFRDNLQWDIADKFGYDLNEGTVDHKFYEFYTYRSRR